MQHRVVGMLGRARAAARRAYLDAPISCGAVKAAEDRLTKMSSRRAAAYAACEPVLDAMPERVYRPGKKTGYGSKVQIDNQLLAGRHAERPDG